MSLNYAEMLNRLADMAGILPEYEADAGIFETNEATKKALLKAMGLPADTETEAKNSLNKMLNRPFERALPPVFVVRREEGEVRVPVSLAADAGSSLLHWTIRMENGHVFGGVVSVAEMPVSEGRDVGGRYFEKRWFSLPVPQEWGYHALRVEAEGLPENGREMPLIVVPQRCYMPDCITDKYRPWGFPLQLYSLRSEKNWGIGDFSDLKQVVYMSAEFGAGLVGINPINTLFATDPETASPYYSSGRLFLNPLYIDVDAVPEAAECEALQAYKKSKEFQEKLKRARDSKLVDYTLVSELKNKALGLLYADFIAKHLEAEHPTERGRALEEFCRAGGRDLRNMAVYQTLAEAFAAKGILGGFHSWGGKYAHPDNQEVADFTDRHADRVGYFMYQQWIADEQFKAASRACEEAGLSIGLYQDLAVGVACESTETWSSQNLFPQEISVGSPPDIFNPNGQEWGVAPMLPDAMKEEAYASYRKILVANMQNAGAVRIDHVMGLARLFWIPKTAPGAYVSFPFRDLVGIVALESHRNRCLVVGEDLGVVPGFFREALEQAGILSFRVFRYERALNGNYIPPEHYPPLALVAAGTHDMPTLPGFWTGSDVEIAHNLGIYDDSAKMMDAFASRTLERRAIIEALSRVGRWFMSPESFENELYGCELPPKMVEYVYRYLAAAPSRLFLPQLEDILNQTEQMNVPGTSTEYPNWRHKLSKTLEELPSDERMQRICAVLRETRS